MGKDWDTRVREKRHMEIPLHSRQNKIGMSAGEQPRHCQLVDFGGGTLNDRLCSLHAGGANALEYTNSEQTNIEHMLHNKL